MGALEPDQMEAVARCEVTPALFREDQLVAFEQWASAGARKLPFHLKVDTGMGRLGVRWEKVEEFLESLSRCPHLELQGIFSHLACADDPDHPLTRSQLERFQTVLKIVRSRGHAPVMCHLANSAAVLDRPPAWLTHVRPGLLLYGYRPSERNQPMPLRPVMRVASRIVYLKELRAGESVGYEGSFSLADCIAEKAIELISQHLVPAVQQPDNRAARDGMALAATLAGLAFSNAGVALVHALEYPLGGALHCSHGAGNGLLLPFVMQFNLPQRKKKFARIAELLGVNVQAMSEQAAAEQAIRAVERLRSAIGIPQRIRDIGGSEDQLPQFAAKAYAIKRLRLVNPRIANEAELLSIYKNAF
jgi:hypothetical protein